VEKLHEDSKRNTQQLSLRPQGRDQRSMTEGVEKPYEDSKLNTQQLSLVHAPSLPEVTDRNEVTASTSIRHSQCGPLVPALNQEAYRNEAISLGPRPSCHP